MQGLFEHGQHIFDQSRTARHPLVVAAASMPVGSVQATPGKALHEPAKQGLVAHVHAQRYLGLLAVTAKGSLANEDPYHHPSLKRRQVRQCAPALRTGLITQTVSPSRIT